MERLDDHLNRNISALDSRFKHDFDSKFVKEVKEAFDFNYMIDIMDDVNDDLKKSQEAFDIIKDHGNSSIKANPVSPEEITRTIYLSIKR